MPKAEPGRKLWSARSLLYLQCGVCETHIAWRLHDRKSLELTATCCGFIFVASPLHEGKRFHVRFYEIDLTNVIPIAFLKGEGPTDSTS
jgi:hypothetical protein